MTETELAIKYAEWTWDDDFPEEVDAALERDYVKYRDLYTDAALGGVRLLLTISRGTPPEEIVKAVHSYLQDC